MCWASCPAPLGRARDVSASVLRAPRHRRLDPRIAERRRRVVGVLEAKGRPQRRGDRGSLGANAIEEHGLLGGVEFAQFERADDLAGDHVRRPRKRLDTPHRPHLTPRDTRDHPVHHLHELGCRAHGVASLVHGGRPGVVRDPFDRDVPPADADDPLDHADVQLLGVEVPALLDVQLDDRRRSRHGRAAPLASRDRSPPMKAIPSPIVLPLLVISLRSAALTSPTNARLPTVPPSSFWKMTTSSGCRVVTLLLGQRLRHLDGAERADGTVEVSALGDRVDVRAEGDRLARRIAAGAPPPAGCRRHRR